MPWEQRGSLPPRALHESMQDRTLITTVKDVLGTLRLLKSLLVSVSLPQCLLVNLYRDCRVGFWGVGELPLSTPMTDDGSLPVCIVRQKGRD